MCLEEVVLLTSRKIPQQYIQEKLMNNGWLLASPGSDSLFQQHRLPAPVFIEPDLRSHDILLASLGMNFGGNPVFSLIC